MSETFTFADEVIIVSGENFLDALSGSALVGRYSSSIILVGNDLTAGKDYFYKNSTAINNVTLFGGSDVVANDIVTSLTDSSKIITFQDKNLDKFVRNTINKPTGDIVKSDVDRITSLSAPSHEITNLAGIANLTNLTELVLSNNQITT